MMTNLRTYSGNEVVEIDEKFYALERWNGECWWQCWRVIPDEKGYCENAEDVTKYDIHPIYAFETAEFEEDDDSQFEIVGYKLR